MAHCAVQDTRSHSFCLHVEDGAVNATAGQNEASLSQCNWWCSSFCGCGRAWQGRACRGACFAPNRACTSAHTAHRARKTGCRPGALPAGFATQRAATTHAYPDRPLSTRCRGRARFGCAPPLILWAPCCSRRCPATGCVMCSCYPMATSQQRRKDVRFSCQDADPVGQVIVTQPMCSEPQR
jgi:hypothetical protein